MFKAISTTKWVIAFLICSLVCSASLYSQEDGNVFDASQMSVSSLQMVSDSLLKKNQYTEATPLLIELVNRIDASKGGDQEISIKLDGTFLALSLGYIQLYLNNNDPEVLKEALIWIERLENEYPESPKLKDALIKKVSLLSIVGKEKEAVMLIEQIIKGSFKFRLNKKEMDEQLLSLTRIYYKNKDWENGLPAFKKLIKDASSIESKAWGAAASFEACFELDKLDEAMQFVSLLTYETEVRYLLRVNVVLFKVSDKMVEKGRFSDATILLNLIKTNDVIAKHHEDSIQKKQNRINQITTIRGRPTEITKKLKQEIADHEVALEKMDELPTLRTGLLMRRARNYAKTNRNYESFWMFNDLMKENPEDEQIELFTYATFMGGLKIEKLEESIEVGRKYREAFPVGERYSPLTLLLVNTLKKTGESEEYVQIAKDFIDTKPQDIISTNLLPIWAGQKLENGKFDDAVAQINKWIRTHKDPIFKDGLHYWLGMAKLQLSDFKAAIVNFKLVLENHPESLYLEDCLLRTGIAYFFSNNFEESKKAFYKYTELYPEGTGYAIDQAYYFLGELETITNNYEIALSHFNTADRLTENQGIHDGCTFSRGKIFEAQERYEEMVNNFKAYLDHFGNTSAVTKVIYQLGRGYEFMGKPSEMLSLYRSYIEKYAGNLQNTGVDLLIDNYTQKYEKNKRLITQTVAFLDKLEEDSKFRESIVMDRGFLFEYFFENKDVDQYLYNRLRNHPNFNGNLINDLSPIDDITLVYREQQMIFPKESPVDFFKGQLNKFRRQQNRIASTRMLMGLYKSEAILPPSRPYDQAFLDKVTPRMLLYIADYSRKENLNFAVEAWNKLLSKYPEDEATMIAYMRLADVNAERDDYNAAIKYLEEAIQSFQGTSKLPSIILRQGELYTLNGQSDKAREKYQYILSVADWRGILHAQALFQIGESYAAEKEYLMAHGYFERTFLAYSQFSDWSARAYLEDSKALAEIGQKADAIATLNEALEILPEETKPELMEPIQDALKKLNSTST